MQNNRITQFLVWKVNVVLIVMKLDEVSKDWLFLLLIQLLFEKLLVESCHKISSLSTHFKTIDNDSHHSYISSIDSIWSVIT